MNEFCRGTTVLSPTRKQDEAAGSQGGREGGREREREGGTEDGRDGGRKGGTYDVAVPPAVSEVGMRVIVRVFPFILAVLVVAHVF
jgi:hypothetical protein